MKIVIIGGGPGGYVAAIKASQFGGEVTLIEKENIGGICVNKGCIPTKAILKSVHPILEREKIEQAGITFSELKIDIDKIRTNSNRAAILSRQGIEYLLKKNKINLIRGEAIAASRNKEIIFKTSNGNEEKVSFDKLIIASGSIVSKIPGIPIDGKRIISSDEALLLREIPERMLIIGGGVVGIEFAVIYRALGSAVTVVEMMEQILPGEDTEAVEVLKKSLSKMGIEIINSCKVENLCYEGEKIELNLSKDGEVFKKTFDTVLMAAGRKPNIMEDIISPLNIEFSEKGIAVDYFMQTNNPDVFAVGDVNGKSMLAHTAYTEAKIAVGRILKEDVEPIDYDLMPRCVYSYPEFASVGKIGSNKSFTFPYAANGRARAQGIKEGLIKLFTEDSKITGCIIVGENATELISQVTIAIKEKIDIHRLSFVTFPHPTFSEIVGEVCEVAEGLPLHI
jgi:dihydrolipoamide dehydrogenase